MAREISLGEALHHGILQKIQEKTDSSGSSVILLPGFWN
jgi:hypothetical protein